MPHAEHEHLDALVATASSALIGEEALDTTRVIFFAAEPCGCHAVAANGFSSPWEIIDFLMHAARCIAEGNGGALHLSTQIISDGHGAHGPAS